MGMVVSHLQPWLVVASGVDDELPREAAVGRDDPDIVVRDEEVDALPVWARPRPMWPAGL